MGKGGGGRPLGKPSASIPSQSEARPVQGPLVWASSPDHVSHVIASGSDKVQADVTLPGWWPMFDFGPEMAVQARRKVYDMLVARKAGKEATTTRSAPSHTGSIPGLP